MNLSNINWTNTLVLGGLVGAVDYMQDKSIKKALVLVGVAALAYNILRSVNPTP